MEHYDLIVIGGGPSGYAGAMRAIDFVGNKSAWSPTVKVVIDRADPVITNKFI